MSRRRCYQEGSLFKRGTRKKVWVARWWEDAIGPEGLLKPMRRSAVLGPVADIPTVREARQMLSDLLRKVNSGDYRPQAIWTLERFVEDRWKRDVFPTLKYSSQKFYTYVLKTHLIPTFGETQLRLITRESIQSFLVQKTRAGLSWKTVTHLRTAFGTILESAFMEDLLASNPVRKTRLPRRGVQDEPLPIDPASIRKLIDHLPEPSRSIAALLAMTGLRIGELLALRWQDVDLRAGEGSSLTVRQTVYEGKFDEPKSRRSKRRIPLGPRCVEILSTLRPEAGDPAGLIFSARNGAPLDRRNLLNRQLKPTADKLAIAGVNWHWLRHAHATMLDSVGAPLGTVQALLGHSSPEVTRDVYIGSVPGDARKAVEGVENLLGPKRTQVFDWPAMSSRAIN